MSFCRITGRSRGLPKPNYFPLLPPISPADAKRFCRITGKAYGLPTHHYIPVLLGFHSHDKSKCRITNASTLGPHHYTAGFILGEKKKHVVLKDYRYVFPVLEGKSQQQKALKDLLDSKQPHPEEENSKFVYTVKERRCSLVFPARLEAAVRDGDVKDVMLSRDCDTVLLRLKQGKNVSVDFRDLEQFDDLYDGLGPREDVLKERERLEAESRKRKKKRQAGLDYAKKIFEDKEKAAEEELKKAKQVKLRSIKEEVKEEKIADWKHVDIGHARSRGSIVMSSSEWNEIVKPFDQSFDWKNFNENVSVSIEKPVVDKLPEPIVIEPQMIDLECTGLGTVTTPISNETGGFETISVVQPFTPLTVEPDENLQEAIKNIPTKVLEDTANANSKLTIAGSEALETLPRINEIPSLVQNLNNGEKAETNKVKGLKVNIESAQRFITGQTVQTPTGPVFVPGQTLQTPDGKRFVPGFTVHTPEGPLLIPGQIITTSEEGEKNVPVFVAGQTLSTKNGERFVQGQTIHTHEGTKFVPGQTVLTNEGPKFVAGQISNDGSFISGQTILTPDGPQFMPGQTITDQHGEQVFVPGQNVQVNETWEFVPGQCLQTSTQEKKFVPGQTMLTTEGPRFIAGQNVTTASGEIHFVPGITIKCDNENKFIPGTNLETPEGLKFVEGQMVKTPEGEKFIPGVTSINANGFQFAAAKNINEVTFLEATPFGISIDPKTTNVISHSQQQEIFGHIVQTEKGVEFIPETVKKLPQGKRVVPGQLIREGNSNLRFLPGIMTEDGFLPGQMVMTESGEQFVPGQVIDTRDGPKFVPGQTVETRTGPKFVPGQTIETAEGPRFVPGQIVETKAGPTFIPGQVISTEDEGSRFVPGQVVDTPDGPRFVPGRVVESEELGVTFVPGQIVQTEHGPRFVAPDLTDTPEGELEFSVQGFEVTPEELKLLRHQHLRHNTSTRYCGEATVDSRMLKQLSEAGMSVCSRNVLSELPNVDIDIDPKAVALEHALVIAEKLGLHGNAAVKMAQIVSTVAQLAKNIAQQPYQQSNIYLRQKQNGVKGKLTNGRSSPITVNNKEKQENGHDDRIQTAIKMAVAAAVVTYANEKNIDDEEKTQSYAFSAISEAFNVLLRQNAMDINQSVDEALQILLIPQNRSDICRGAMADLLEESNNKVDILKSTVVGNLLKDDVVLDRLSQVLEEENGNDLVGSAFRTVSKGDPELVSRVLRKVSEEVGGVATEKEAVETVHKAIVQAVRESSEIRVKELLNDEGSKVREMILQAVGLARALGMSSIANSLLAVISDETSTRALAGDKVTLDILKRLTVMRKLAETRPQCVNALRDLCSDPETARKDPRLRTLVRESAALMIVPEEAPINSSDDVPTSLLHAENSLAIEDFLIRRKHRASSVFMILKQGMQAVVPREAARSVLTGEVAYTLLDENGVRHFEPLDVFSALTLTKPAAHRFSMYRCPVVREEDVENELLSTFTGPISITSASSMDEYAANENGGFLDSSAITLTASERTDYSMSRENTPSFRRLSSLHFDRDLDRKSENYIVVKDYKAEDEVDFSVNVGDIVEAIEYADPSKTMKIDKDLEVGVIENRLDNSAARHKLSIRPRRKHLDPRARILKSSSNPNVNRVYVRTASGKEGWLPMSIVMQTALSEESSTITSHHRPEDSKYRREAVIKELVETEEEFGRDLQQVVERYLKPLDNPEVPRIVRDNKDLIFSNLKHIADFHNTSFGRVLIEGVKYYADQPRMLGKTFLRLERDFDKHVAYCRDEPNAQEFLQLNDEVREYFEERSQTLGDDKSVAEHLKLPIQRINDYQLLLKELVKYSTRLGEDCDDLQKALELMLGIPHRAADNKFISNIEGYKGNIHKLGRLLTHEWYTVIDKEGKSKERYLFLFKARILVCKVRRISEDRSVFVLKDIIRLPEVEVKDHPENVRIFELHQPGTAGFPITLIAHKDPVKAYWLKEIRQYASDVVALAEHAADDLQLTEESDIGEEPKEPTAPELIEPPTTETKPVAQKAETCKVEVAKVVEEKVKKEVKALPTESEESKVAESKYPTVGSPKAQPEEVVRSKPESPQSEEVESPVSVISRKGSLRTESRRAWPEEPLISEKRKEEIVEVKKYRGDPKRAWPGEPPVPERKKEEVKEYSEVKRTKFGAWPGDPQPPEKTKEEEANMSRRYSSSRYSASSRLVEEYTSISSSRNGISSYMESSVSATGAATKEYSSTYGTAKISETSSSYEASVRGGDEIAETRSAKLALETSETGKPSFSKTIEGCSIEPGESAVFECALKSTDKSTKMQWLKDNKPLDDKLADRVKISTDDTTFKLEIENVLESDSGIYIARAMNDEGASSCTAQLVVQELTAEERKARADANAPIFLVRLKDTELLQNTYLRFMIKVKGDPNPDVKFYKDGVLIDSKNERIKIIMEKADKGFYELVIPDVQECDAGKYSCTASNRFGETSCEAKVTVCDEKTIFTGLPEGMTEPGEEPKFIWTRDGVPFDPEERFKVLFKDNEDTLALVFQHVKPEDAGLYTCVAQTNTGNISCSAELTVQGTVKHLLKEPEKPVLGSESKQSEVTVGGSAMLDCQVKGFPKPDIKWFKDGSEIIAGGRIKYLWEDEESLSLVIKNVTAQDAGTYTIKAKNDLGEDSTQIELIVKSAPKIVKKMTDVTVLTKQTITMEVHIQASPAPEVKWYKDGHLIQASDRITITKEGNDKYKLIIKDARIEDAGSYTIVAKNEINQTSDMWDVKVKYPPRITKKLEERKIINESDSLTLLIEVDADPKPSVTWYKESQVITEDERITISEDDNKYMLKISSVIDIDAAVYKVEVKNKDGVATDKTDVKVRCKPRFKTKLEDAVTKDGQNEFEFVVDIDSFEKPTVRWYIGDMEITESRKEFAKEEQGTRYTLKFKEIKSEMTGTYTCKATNDCGECESSATFTVYSKPKIIKKLVDQKLKEGETLNLKVEISGTPDPEVTWFKDGKEVSADANIKITRDSNRKENYDLTVTVVKGSDGGNYEVRASNELGMVMCKSKVIVLTKSEEVVEDSEQNAEIKDVQAEEQQAEESGPEGHVKLEKQKVEVIRNAGDTITISMASTTTHEAIMTGPDESHSISKMTSTKVECQELNTEGPHVEEIASYTYTIHEENGLPKAQNGILIEEFSESDDDKAKLIVNRGISIVSVSDDESTLKGICTDASNDDVHGELLEDAKLSNGSYDGRDNFDRKTAAEEQVENVRPCRATLLKETIIEEHSMEDSVSEKLKVTDIHEESQTPVAEKNTFSRQNSIRSEKEMSRQSSIRTEETMEKVNEEKKFSRQSSTRSEKKISRENSLTSEDKLSRQNSIKSEEENKFSRQSSIMSEKKYSRESSMICEGKLSRQSSLQTDIQQDSLPQTPYESGHRKFFRETSVTVENDLSRQNSLQTEINEPETPQKAQIENSPYSRQNSVTCENQLSRRSSQIEILELSEPQKAILHENGLSRQCSIKSENQLSRKSSCVEFMELDESQNAVLHESSLSRQSSKLERVASTEAKKVTVVPISRENSETAWKDDEEEDEEMKALFDRIKKQRSVLDEILDKQGEKEQSAPPSIVSSNLEDREIFETQTLRFEVKTSALPRPEAKWFKDGIPIKQSNRLKSGNTGDMYHLTLSKATLEDSGIYTVIFTNKLGEISAEGFLTVSPVEGLRKPKFIRPLTDVDVVAKHQGVFKAVVTGEPIPEVAWFFKDEELSVKDKDKDAKHKAESRTEPIQDGLKECTFQLKVNKCNPDDIGKYTIKVKNKYGEAESSADLDLLIPPELEEFKNLEVPVGEEITWEAIIKANPKPDIVWEKDGKDLSENDRFSKDEEYKKRKYKLIIKGVETEDAGTYKVTATNEYGTVSGTAELTTYSEAPAFENQLKNECIRDQNTYEADIRVSGFPRPSIKWFKDGVEIISDDRRTITTDFDGHVTSKLVIKKFSEKDVGVIKCQAKNYAGTAETTAQLSLTKFPPTFDTTLPGSLDIDEGEPLELIAHVDGSPIPVVKWLKDGEEIKPDGHIKLETLPDGAMKLSIDKLKPTDSGSYKVVAVNKEGEQSTSCAVAVMPEHVKPHFSKPLEDKKVTVGEPLRLEAQIVAVPNPTVQWFKDGAPIRQTEGLNFESEPNGVMVLSIDKVRPENAGTYSLVVTNPLGKVTSSSTVEVEEKESQPSFLESLQPITIVEGFPAKLEIKLVGKPTPILKWNHNGKEIVPDGKHIKIVDLPDGVQALLIDKAIPEDSGEYEVIAINSKGLSSCKGQLSVASKTNEEEPQEKPEFLSPLRDISVEERELLNFSAPFKGNPIPDITWLKDGKALKPSERILLTCDGKKVMLEINPSNLKDSGTYTCKLKNPLGEDTTSAQATVRNVYQPPTFTQKFTDIQQLPKCDVKFPARVTGVPCPDITWYYNNKPILGDSDKYKIKRDGDACCLYVKDCTFADSGRYKCEAVNKDGKASCEATLSVVDKIEKMQKVEPPSFLKKIGDCEVYKGMTAKFTACITGYPEPEFEWFRDNNKLWPTDRIHMDQEGSLLRLSIYNVDDSDAGTYKLRIFNPHGEDSCQSEMIYESLEQRKKPLADQYIDYDKYRKSGLPLPLADRPLISRMMDRHLTLSWRPSIPIGPRIPVTYLVEMCELPDGEWFTARSGIRGCVCDIRNLVPFHDYKFRIRVENKYGISDPSPYAQTYRAKLEPEPPKFFPYLPPGIDFRPETSPYFPKDFDIERPPYDNYAQAPRFLRQEHDTQYGVKNHNCNLFWFVYGYPKPKMTYYFNDELIESGGRYDQTYTRNGQATLFINKMLERDVGIYEAVATNEHGEARQRVRLEIAEYPTFIERPDETFIMIRKCGKIEARVTGVPYPELKWYKDWKPLAPSTRIKILFAEPDKSILLIEDAIAKDEGLYSLSARNVAGCASSSAMVHIEEDEHEYGYRMYTRKYEVEPRNKPIGDFYDLGDELGRGTQGVTYHAVERHTGKHYAAKCMHGGGEFKTYMHNELEALNNLNHRKLLRLHDAYESINSMTLITELAAGGELVDTLTKQPYYTEIEIAGYIRQILWGLEYMHSHSYAHLGLTLSDLLISHPGGDDLKICDFGLARRIGPKLMTLNFGMPEFVAPEVVNGEGVSYGADMWSVGIITYILLSGISPFRGINDRETLTKIKEGKWGFDDRWIHISEDAKDFIRGLLAYQDHRRFDIQAALRHPWLTYADRHITDVYQIQSENLKNYYKLYRDWYTNSSCRTWYRRRKLSGAFEHPSKMVYPPGHKYTPEQSPERTYSPTKKSATRTWENKLLSREPIDTEIGIIKSESHYQNGPDTYLLQLRDTDFPVRLREYMKVAHNCGFPKPVADDGYDWRTPVIRERRRFTDVMDEEIDDERKARINQYGNVDTGTLRRLKHELGTRLDSYAEVEALMESKKGGHVPFFREKPQIRPIEDGKPAQLACFAVGNPKPIIQWFKNDLVIQESNRVKITEDNEGRSILSFNPAKEHDIGIYKVVARNRVGQTVARTRVLIATVPSAPDSPECADASESEILLRWKQPKYDGNSSVLCYHLQYKAGDSIEWISVADNIDHEFFLIKNLKPNTSYQFRLAARNRIGWSEKGIPTKLIKTREGGLDVPKVQITRAMRHLQEITESGQEIVIEESKPNLNYSIEDNPINWCTDVQITSKYTFISELSRGQFSIVAKGIEKATDRVIVAKIFEVNSETEDQISAEFEVLRSLRHEKIALLESAYKTQGSPYAVFIMEKLQGADVLTYLSSRHEYTENCVATIVTQILDALQYLHWRGYCHLDIQPDNVVMASVRSVQVKLVDFGSAQKVSKLGALVPQGGHLEYRAPEVLNEEPAYPQTDIWMVGVLTYVLLSGVSPFRGKDTHETKQNITFVRYRFEYLYKELSQEATRFLMLVFKRMPSKRPTAEECHEHRWLLPTEFMIKKRERAVFLGNRLKEYSEEYHEEKQKRAMKSERLTEALGSSRQLNRSNSIQDELLTTF